MRRSRRWTDDRGSASLEFVTVGLLLLLPLIYLVLVISAVQSAALATEAAARHAARLFVQQPDLARAERVADQAVRFALDDYGIDSASSRVAITCDPAACLEPGALVTVRVTVSVPLPLAPPVLPGDFPLSVDLAASAAQRVSTFGPG
jgi:Flp pilus assembly protein TadG